MEYPYEDALSGTWTLDKFISISESVTTDLNGDGVVDTNDRIGLLGWHNTMQPFFTSCGLNYTEVNSAGRRVLLTPTDQMVSAAEKIFAFCHSDSFIEATANKLTTNDTLLPFFMNGQTMFFGQVLSTVENLREMEADFGIVPYPKYDEAQENYYTTILRSYSVAAIPTTAASSANSAMILEALAADGAQNIVPRYYEIALKSKYVRDDDSSKVLDLIKDSLYLEFTDIYYSDRGTSDFFPGYVLFETEGTFVSSYTAKYSSWSEKLDKLYETQN